MRAPTILELSVEKTLEPRVAFVQRAACVPDDSVGKLLLKSPSLLTCTEAQMQLRVDFLRRAGFDDVQMGKAVVAFPQVRLAVGCMRCYRKFLFVSLLQRQISSCPASAAAAQQRACRCGHRACYR